MNSSVQLGLGPMEVHGSENRREGGVRKVDGDAMSVESAKAQLGGAVRHAIRGRGLKDFGDPSLVKRVCDGEVPTVLAQVWKDPETRRELVTALAEASGLAEVSTTIRIRRMA